MPTVTRVKTPSVRPQLARGARASAMNVSAYETNAVSQGLEDVARAGMVLQKRKEKADQAAALDAVSAFEREYNDALYDPDTGYLNTKGEAAYKGAGAFQKQMKKLRDARMKSLESEGARREFERVSAAHMNRVLRDVDRHASSGLNEWEIEGYKAQLENTIENAALRWDQPDQVDVQLRLGRETVRDVAESEGITDPDIVKERLEAFDSSFASAAIRAAAVYDAKAARDLLGRRGDLLTGTERANVEAVIQQKERVQKERDLSGEAVLAARRIVEDHPRNRTAMLDAVAEIDDPELADKVLSEATARFNQREIAYKEQQAQNYNEALDAVLHGGVTGVEHQAQNPEMWEEFTAEQKQNLLAGKDVKTNQPLWNTLNLLSDAELAELDVNDFANQLSRSDQTTLSKKIKDAREGLVEENQAGRTRAAQIKSREQQLFGEAKDRNDEQMAMVDQYHLMVTERLRQKENELKRSVTSSELNEVINEVSRDVTYQRTIFGHPWSSTERNVFELAEDFEMEPQEMDSFVRYLKAQDAPVNNRTLTEAHELAKIHGMSGQQLLEITEYLRDNNLQVTSENIQGVIEQLVE